MRRPQTYFAFPVEEHSDKQSGKRGVAIIVAVMVISLMMVFTADMIVSSQVNLELVSAARDNTVAEYMAKSGYNLALFLLSVDYGVDLFKQTTMKEPPTDSLADMWAMLNGMPIGASTAELFASMQEKFSLSAIADSDVMQRLKLFQGEFTLNVSDEAAKINVNYCVAGANRGACRHSQEMLLALFSCPIEKSYLESKDVEPLELVKKFQDWVDSDKKVAPQSGLGDESDPYSRLNPPYRAKNSHFDSIAELKLIDQWDDDLHTVFAPYLTVYPFGKKQQGAGEENWAKVNINTVSRELLACLVPEARSECGETYDLAMVKSRTEKIPLAENLPKTLEKVLCIPPSDKNKKKHENRFNWFTESSPVYRIEVKGTVGFQEKKLQAVIKRGLSKEKGKEATAYQLLYWQMS